MKPGDIVTVHDGSWSLSYRGDGKKIDHTDGIALRGRRWRVLLAGVTLPAAEPYDTAGTPNDTVLCEVEAPEQILFTRSQFCAIVSRPGKVPDRMDVDVPFGTKKVVIHVSV